MKVNSFFIFLIILLSLVFWQIWLAGPKVATDFPLVSIDSLKSAMDLPRTWNDDGTEGLGEDRVLTLWAWPYSFVSGVLANLGLDFPIQERILYLIPFLLVGSIGIWKLCKKFNLSNYATFVSSLFYLANTYILLVIDGGQLRIALAYAWFPICLLSIEGAIKGNIRSKVLAAVIIYVLGFWDIRFILMLFFFSVIRFLYGLLFDLKNWNDWFIKWISLGTVSGMILLGLNFYWIYPLIVSQPESDLYTSLTQTSFLSFSSLGHSMLLISPHWFKNIFGQVSPLRWEFILIPALVFLAPILKPKNYWVGFWLIVALISIFLAKGALEPFSEVYPWLYSNIPGFSLFRDSTKFFFLVALSYSILIGITVDEIILKTKQFSKLFLIFIIFYLLFLVSPVWSGQMTGIFSKSQDDETYQDIRQALLSDQQFSRVFWIPSVSSLGLIDPKHPPVEASRLVNKRPFATGVKGTYEFFNFLREAPYMGQIFDIAGISYIVYPPLDPKKQNLSQDDTKYYQTFSNQLSQLPWLSKIDNLPIFKVKEHQDKFFIVKNTWWVVGSDDLYKQSLRSDDLNEATKSVDLKLSENAFVFAEEEAGLINRFEEFKNSKIILYKKTLMDLAASFINSDAMIFPAMFLDKDPNASGWWKRNESDLIEWRYFLKTKYELDNQDFGFGRRWAVGEGSVRLEVGSEKWEVRSGNILLARVMESSRSGELKFYQDDQLIGEVVTKTDDNANVRWFEVGKLVADQKIVIESEGDINVVNALAALPAERWQQLQSKAESLEKDGKVFRWEDLINYANEDLPTLEAEVSYEQVNPTLYRVKVSKLHSPLTLVFSESYSPYWKINGQQALQLYSLINGFQIDKDGEYKVSFESQKYIIPGFLVSGALLILLLAKAKKWIGKN